MPPGALVLLAVLGLAACATPAATREPARAADFQPSQIRQPALVVRVQLGPGPWSERERQQLAASYEHALLEELNARAIAAVDVRVGDEAASGAQAAVARAREVGADHAIVITVRVDQVQAIFCRGSRRPFRAVTTAWRQQALVLRASDGAERARLAGDPLTVTDVEPDCENPNASRRRPAPETASQAVSRLLGRLLASS